MNKVYFLIGGNIGDRHSILSDTRIEIEKNIGKIENVSSLYETEPWGFSHEQNFLNQVIVINTNKEPITILCELQKIEKKLGRIRKTNQYSERTIDIDIIFFNDLCMESPELTIPHAKIQERMFALEPLFEVNKDFIHPKLNKTIAYLKNKCNDKLKVTKVE